MDPNSRHLGRDMDVSRVVVDSADSLASSSSVRPSFQSFNRGSTLAVGFPLEGCRLGRSSTERARSE